MNSPIARAAVGKPAAAARADRALLQRTCACGNGSRGGGECEGCRKKRGELQRHTATPSSETNTPGLAPQIVHDVLRSSGHPLDSSTRARMESRFGHDFSSVRVHTDNRSAQSAQQVNAHAYTVGAHVVFGAAAYQPGTRSGLRLIAHELAHVVQQGGKPTLTGNVIPIGAASCPSERDADAAAEAAVSSLDTINPVAVTGSLAPQLSRETRPDGTNFRFDTFNITEADLNDPDIIARFDAMTDEGLRAYQSRVADPAVQTYIQNLIASRIVVPPAPIPCTKDEVKATKDKAEAARSTAVSMIGLAQKGLDRLHSAWIDNKGGVLAGTTTLSGVPVCAFDSNFNTTQRSADYGVLQIRVSSRLGHLAARLGKPVAYECQATNDPTCTTTKDGQTEAFVVNHQPPIHFCAGFRDNLELNSQLTTVIHEFAHLLPGVGDQGGYAAVLGATATTCAPNLKFTAASDVLANTADPLASFVFHIGDSGSVDVRAK